LSYLNAIKEAAVQRLVRQIVAIASNLSEEGFVRATYLAEALPIAPDQRAHVRKARELIRKKHPGMQLIQRALRHLSPNCRDHLVVNLFVNSIIFGQRKRALFEEKKRIKPPFLLVISPTMRCNLNCYGCYAGNYSKKDDLEVEVVDRVLREAKEMGIYFITISGGEPLIWDGLLEIFERHNDMYFQIYTNGTLIDRRLAKRLAELGNVAAAISMEGFEEETDARRGKGTFATITRNMEGLREEGVLYGFSACATRQNIEVVSDEDFVDRVIEMGCLYGWYFIYIPIGRKPDLNLMPSPEQRDLLRRRVWDFRRSKPIFIGDFWNDGPLVHGCIAGGRHYLHINSRGDVEPCVFAHFAVDNIKQKSLAECLQSPFFAAIRARQPFNQNHLLPCMIIDNPEILREVVLETGAYPTHEGAETLIGELHHGVRHYAKTYRKIADKVWQEEYSYREGPLIPRILIPK